MAVARLYGFEIDFAKNPISGSASLFFVLILKFIFTPVFEILPPAWELKKLMGQSAMVNLVLALYHHAAQKFVSNLYQCGETLIERNWLVMVVIL